MSELYRLKFHKNYKALQKILDNNKFICTGKLGTNICKIDNGGYYKMPKLIELYTVMMGESNFDFHSAKNDVYAITNMLKKICEYC